MKRSLTIEKLLELYAAGERDFTRIKIDDGDPFDFTRSRGLMDIDLSRADLRFSDVHWLTREGITWTMREGDLRGLDLQCAHFDESDLSGTDLRYAFMFRAMFHDANLSRVNFSGADLGEAIFYNANLTGATFHGATLTEVNFDKANLERTDFSYAYSLTTASFEGAIFLNTIMPNGTIRNSNS